LLLSQDLHPDKHCVHDCLSDDMTVPFGQEVKQLPVKRILLPYDPSQELHIEVDPLQDLQGD